MNKEIPYNPPGMDSYIREGARKNSALLRKMQGKPEQTATAEAKPDCAPRTGSASLRKTSKYSRKANQATRKIVLIAETATSKDLGWQDVSRIMDVVQDAINKK
jgi:hypothetical protein